MKNAGIRVYKKKVGDFEGVFIILVMALTFEDDDVSDFLSLRLLILILIICLQKKKIVMRARDFLGQAVAVRLFEEE